MLLKRTANQALKEAFKVNPVVGLLGPRQSGKSTLARMYANSLRNKEKHYFDLEDPRDLERLSNPMLALENLEGLVIIDEIQKKPDLFQVLRVLVDQKKRKINILILGSASRDLIQQSSETLAGRISYVDLNPLSLDEVKNSEQLFMRGGFPLSYLAKTENNSFAWRKNYISTFLERDLFDFGFRIAPTTIRRFWMMIAHYHGQVLNFSELSSSFGVSDMTVRKYIEILKDTFMIRLLQPWYENISKRQVKTPKIYIRDSGIFHTLIGVENKAQLQAHPKLGASWEGFAIEQIIRLNSTDSENCFFWGSHNISELDLLVFKNGKRIGYEVKYSDVPKFSASMKIVLEDLKLDQLIIVVPKTKKYELIPKVSVCSLAEVIK